jgi:peptidyl-tRNA hydrolase, PTH1 family
MKLIIGLGNPGKKYETTRHNTGFAFLDFLKQSWNFPEFESNKKFNAEISEKNYQPQTKNYELLLVRPQTFMNLAGVSVQSISDFYKLSPADIIVVHDDLDIETGKYKIAIDSSSAGHNGVADIIEKLGTQKFMRLRIGIGNQDLRTKIDPTDFVLQKFSDEERKSIQKLFPEMEGEIKKLL